MKTKSEKKKIGKKGKYNLSKGAIVFIVVMLAYPVLHFLINWLYINSRTIFLSFTRYNPAVNDFQIPNDVFYNYKMWIERILFEEKYRMILVNSLLYFPVTCFVTLPLSIGCSYFLYKGVPGKNVFKVIYFLPSILPVVVLTMAFRFGFDTFGYVNAVLKGLGVSSPPVWFGSDNLTPFMIFAYCVWAGIGYNVILLAGAMGRVPTELIEYGKLEGVGMGREMVQIVIPLIWPTVVTLFTVGMNCVLTIYLQAYFLMGSTTDGNFNTGTIALYIFGNYSNETQIPQLSSFGLLCSLLYVPIIFLARKIMNRFFKEVDY